MQPFEDLRAMENNGTNVTVVKAALQILGNDCGATRPPAAWPLQPPAQQRLEQFMDNAALVR
jgi:4-hydroxy-tetrahydrodipicolinate synthase